MLIEKYEEIREGLKNGIFPQNTLGEVCIEVRFLANQWLNNEHHCLYLLILRDDTMSSYLLATIELVKGCDYKYAKTKIIEVGGAEYGD